MKQKLNRFILITKNRAANYVIGAHYDTDKSSQRKNVTDSRHCHPYTLFYNSIFRNKKDEDLAVAEVGDTFPVHLC